MIVYNSISYYVSCSSILRSMHVLVYGFYSRYPSNRFQKTYFDLGYVLENRSTLTFSK